MRRNWFNFHEINNFKRNIGDILYSFIQAKSIVIGDIRAESAWRFVFNMRVTGYAKISKIRCLWSVAPCHGSKKSSSENQACNIVDWYQGTQ